MTQGPDQARSEVDPMVVDVVKTVRDRFGAVGLRNLVTLAQDELARVEQAEMHLATIDRPEPAAVPESFDAADTQAWLAYTELAPDLESGDRS